MNNLSGVLRSMDAAAEKRSIPTAREDVNMEC